MLWFHAVVDDAGDHLMSHSNLSSVALMIYRLVSGSLCPPSM